MIIEYKGARPECSRAAFIAENASIIGKVELSEGVNVWFGAVLRGDNDHIRVGRNVNIQDNAIIHVDEGFPVSIGDNATIGHAAIVHGCTIGEGSMVGMNAVVLNGARIGRNSIVGAGALVTAGKIFPDNSLILGSPARLAGEVSEKNLKECRSDTEIYLKLAAEYAGEQEA